MDREFKIVASIFMLFLIFGLSSIYYNGAFVTPIFLNQLVLLGVAVAFFIMNRSVHKGWILLVYIPIQILSCLVDGFTVGFLAERFGAEFLIDVHKSQALGVVFLVGYFGYMLFLTFFLYKNHQLKWGALVSFALLILTITAFFFPDFYMVRDILFLVFLFFFYVSYHRFSKEKSKVLGIMSNQLLLLFFLEGLEYFH